MGAGPEEEAGMAEQSPFDFDIRVSTAKKKRRRRRGMTGEVESSTRQCEYPGCRERGLYRAPRSPDVEGDYLWFCLEHVREYNRNWNYFATQGEDVLLEKLRSARIWERPTHPFARHPGRQTRAWSRLGIEDPFQILGDKATRRPTVSPAGRRLSPTERRALKILDAQEHWTRKEIRRQYKSLVKDLHPDMNGGNRADEERLQQVVWAWEQLRESRNIPD